MWRACQFYSPITSGKLARWALTIQEMDLAIRHKPGHANSNADALSRNEASVNTVTSSVGDSENWSDPDLDAVAEMQLADPLLVPMLEYIKGEVLPTETRTAERMEYESPTYPGQWCVYENS